jgi:transcriptional regulator
MSRGSLDLFRGTLDILILKTLSQRSMHGYEIAKWITHSSEAVIQIEEGALYPALRRLQAKGWLASEWGISETNREVKFYTLTKEGRRQLHDQEETWSRYVEAMAAVMKAAEA